MVRVFCHSETLLAHTHTHTYISTHTHIHIQRQTECKRECELYGRGALLKRTPCCESSLHNVPFGTVRQQSYLLSQSRSRQDSDRGVTMPSKVIRQRTVTDMNGLHTANPLDITHTRDSEHCRSYWSSNERNVDTKTPASVLIYGTQST